MSTNEYMSTVPYWLAAHLDRQAIVDELTDIAGELARADDGRLLLGPAMRKDLEDRRKELKQELARLDATEQHQEEEEEETVGNVNVAEVERVMCLARSVAAEAKTVRTHLAALGFDVHTPEPQTLEFMDPTGQVLSVQGSAARQFAATK